jgi:nucleotide-binding universal stress UspA family protein
MSRLPASVDHLPIRLKRILFAANFTETSATALPYAAAFARRFGSEILVAHVIPQEEYGHIEPERLDAALVEMKQAARKRIEGLLAASSFSDIPFRIHLGHGDVMTVIASLVEKENIDLIVAGSEGRHGIQKLLSPSKDEEIARAAPCPVLLIGPEVAVAPEAEMRIERILHPTDFHPQSKPVMEYAYALAEAYAADLCLLHVADNIWKEPLSTRMTPEAFCRMRLLENGLPEHEPTIEPSFQVEFGSPESLILEAAQKRGVQLIVMGVPLTAHPGFSSHLPGPLVYDVASHALSPVLAVRHAKRDESEGATEAAAKK